MPAAKYTSFQIKNTASVPMEVSLTDPNGDSFSIGPIDPGSERAGRTGKHDLDY